MRLELIIFCRRHSDLNGDTTSMATHGFQDHCLTIRLIPAYGEYRALAVWGTSV